MHLHKLGNKKPTSKDMYVYVHILVRSTYSMFTQYSIHVLYRSPNQWKSRKSIKRSYGDGRFNLFSVENDTIKTAPERVWPMDQVTAAVKTEVFVSRRIYLFSHVVSLDEDERWPFCLRFLNILWRIRVGRVWRYL